jgi:hypothetical protein
MNKAKKQDSERLFQIIGQDAQTWLEQAKLLKMSAEVIKAEIDNVLPLPQVLPGVRERKLAYIQSFMLLNGLAFENLIKGIIIGRDPTIVDQQKVNTKYWNFRKGHGIAELAKTISRISRDEFQLLKRLEEYVFWAGRYPMPLKSGIYSNSQNPENLLTYLSTDSALIDCLFNKLCEIFQSEWEVRSDTNTTCL